MRFHAPWSRRMRVAFSFLFFRETKKRTQLNFLRRICEASIFFLWVLDVSISLRSAFTYLPASRTVQSRYHYISYGISRREKNSSAIVAHLEPHIFNLSDCTFMQFACKMAEGPETTDIYNFIKLPELWTFAFLSCGISYRNNRKRHIQRSLGIIMITLTKVSYTPCAKILKDINTHREGEGRRVIDLLDDRWEQMCIFVPMEKWPNVTRQLYSFFDKIRRARASRRYVRSRGND